MDIKIGAVTRKKASRAQLKTIEKELSAITRIDNDQAYRHITIHLHVEEQADLEKLSRDVEALFDRYGIDANFTAPESAVIDKGRRVRRSLGSASNRGWEQNVPKDETGTTNFQWNHHCVKFPQAIQKAMPPDPARRYPGLDPSRKFQATAIRVFQFDTGWSTHPKIYAYGKGFNISPDISLNFIGNERDRGSRDDLKSYFYIATQDSGHGTSTAHTFIGGKPKDKPTNRPTPGSLFDKDSYREDLNSGLFPYVRFFPQRIAKRVVFNFNLGTNSPQDMYNAVLFASYRSADVITMSMGGENSKKNEDVNIIYNKYYKMAADRAYRNGILFFCAAGNSAVVDELVGVVKPAELAGTIAVAGIEPEKQDSGKIRYIPWRDGCDGKAVNISAPAKYVYTAYKKRSGRRRNLYKWGGGTSNATVHAAAAGALWKHYFQHELSHQWYKDEPHRIVDAFLWGLDKSKWVPEYWSEKERRSNKGILNAEALLSPEWSPQKYRERESA